MSKVKHPRAGVILSSTHRIGLPEAARVALGAKAGSRILVVVRGRTVILRSTPGSAARALAGAARRKYLRGYLDRERASWP